ncbi:ABC transporter permease [Simkania sp.]|uniref:ABC transporter permease n=1 Tax=Simkania sp. TaxID=34094 RepID=UPI003B52199E
MEGIQANEAASVKAKKKPFRFAASLEDLWSGIKQWRVWLLLGWLDLKLRYRRSYLGPFWITISMAVMIYSMGFVYSKLFHMNLAEYFLYISGGMLAWFLLSTTLIEMMHGFTDSQTFILQLKMPFSVYIMRVITRNFIVLGHNVLAVLPLLICFKCMPNFPLVFFALAVIAVSMLSIGTLFAMIGARFRDVQQVIASILQVGFLLTPVMWNADMIPGRAILAVYMNPFYYYVELLRCALLNTHPPAIVIKGCVAIALGGTALMLLVFSRLRHRIPFWL